MTTNSCQNMNDGRKYIIYIIILYIYIIYIYYTSYIIIHIIIPFIGHPYVIIKKSLTMDINSINKNILYNI